AVEIRSPGQTIESQRERCRFYLTHGAEEAWLVIPETRTIEVFDGERDGTAYTSGTVPSSSLAGFVVEVEALFEGLGSEYA
ncbi:MAG: Uma2 family endonuclease, partial [Dehalococcoidia bacterium]